MQTSICDLLNLFWFSVLYEMTVPANVGRLGGCGYSSCMGSGLKSVNTGFNRTAKHLFIPQWQWEVLSTHTHNLPKQYLHTLTYTWWERICKSQRLFSVERERDFTINLLGKLSSDILDYWPYSCYIFYCFIWHNWTRCKKCCQLFNIV